VTVLFADLSGFTAMAERMDPEDVKALADDCAERISAEVRRVGGTVLNVMGDAVVAVFGAPVAHEDDPERAVRAALAIRGCSLPSPRGADGGTLQVHVGVNTGEVMAGLVGPEERRDYTVMGDTVNTAARLMSAAPRGSVLVGEETYRATRRLVQYREVGPIDARGKERPVGAWEALEVAPLPLARSLGSAPLLGRDDELTLLAGIWAKVVREGRPHLVAHRAATAVV
jgi:class 3 adenylate cyclase